MSQMHRFGPAMRALRTDRDVVDQRVSRRTLARVLDFARPQRRTIAVFLALVIIDASLVVVTPLLIQRLLDAGILGNDPGLVTWLALGIAGVAVLNALIAVGVGFLPLVAICHPSSPSKSAKEKSLRIIP